MDDRCTSTVDNGLRCTEPEGHRNAYGDIIHVAGRTTWTDFPKTEIARKREGLRRDLTKAIIGAQCEDKLIDEMVDDLIAVFEKRGLYR